MRRRKLNGTNCHRNFEFRPLNLVNRMYDLSSVQTNDIGLILVLLLQEKAERKILELKNKISILQQEMGNSEAVQKDFVRLSQSLQVNHEHSMKFNIFTIFFDYFSTIRWN